MTTRELIDPELLPGLEFFPDADLSPDNLPRLRREVDAIFAATPLPTVLDIHSEERRIAASRDHEIDLLVHRPRRWSGRQPAILHMHSGGYVFGSARMSMAANQILVADLGCMVISVNYRLAPETPFPGPLEDCYAALRWMHENASSLGIDSSRIAVAGESAGGGLAAALALLARDRGEFSIAHQQLSYPMLDDRPTPRHPYAGEFVWTRDANRLSWQALLGEDAGGEAVSPYAAAARTEDLSGLPGAFILVGALDLFIEQNMDYARRLIRAGVPTELHVYPGAYHAFDMLADAAVAERARKEATAALKRALR